MTKAKKMKCEVHIAKVGETGKAYRVLAEKPKEKTARKI
jgi:hypothetical protein